MPYTLVKGLVWVVLALLLGGVIGWLLRSLTSRRQIAKARSAAAAAPSSPAAGATPADTAELERLRIRLAEFEPIVVERDRLRAQLTSVYPGDALVGPPRPATTSGPLAVDQPPTADLAAATVVLGHVIELNDLRVVLGVGPAIQSLCHGIGIRTWLDLATTETSLLRTMLSDAGPTFAVNDPASWPEQARLLAEGRWAEFKTLTETLAADRPGD